MKIYNSLGRTKQNFESLETQKVKMYVCGITPYDTTHLGHAFTYVFFDTLRRYFAYKGYDVIYTQNVTDIDDDILKRAKAVGKDWKELGDFWTNRFLDDMKGLSVLLPTYYVRATQSIDRIIQINIALLEKGLAYEKKGNIYFDVNKDKNYGELSQYSKAQMELISQERGGNLEDPLKKNPLDFLLWQKSTTNEPGWNSPWGKGRPGWHIECSSMINQYLGDQIDIHGGGHDLIYPHHESEIAQSESYTGKKPFVKYWLHTGMVMYEGEKMSKSLGNLVMAKDLLKTFSANSIRFLLLSHHYRKPWEYFEEEMIEADRKSKRIGKALKEGKAENLDEEIIAKFEGFMDDDLDTPEVLRMAGHLAEDVLNGNAKKTASLKKIMETLGFSF